MLAKAAASRLVKCSEEEVEKQKDKDKDGGWLETPFWWSEYEGLRVLTSTSMLCRDVRCAEMLTSPENHFVV